MARVKGLLLSVQVTLLFSVICCVLGGTLPEQQESSSSKKSTESDVAVAPVKSPVALTSSPDQDQDHPNINMGRAKRYIGWERKPSLRYSKASSTFDHDNLFNKMYNNFDKRSRLGPEAPISSFRELRMKQKIPNAQVLLPHLFSRTSRAGYDAEPTLSGSDLAMALDQEAPSRLSEDDFETLLYLLENAAKNIRNDQQ